jgi:hypothetical protein
MFDFLSEGSKLLLAIFSLIPLVGVVAVLIFGKGERASAFSKAVPLILEQIRELVNRAEAQHKQLQVDYAAEAELTGHDPRKLWVADQVVLFVNQFGIVKVDRDWVYEQIEQVVLRLKQYPEYEVTVEADDDAGEITE